MGLTVHCGYEFRGSKTELMRKLEGLRSQFLDLPVASVNGVVDVPRISLKFPFGHHRDERYDQSALGYMMVLSYFGVSAPERALGDFYRRIGGKANVNSLPHLERRRYCRLRQALVDIRRRQWEKITRSGNGLSLRANVGEGCKRFEVMLGRLGNGRLWRGSRLTETRYVERSVPCHLVVVRMLDHCKNAGILKFVRHDGRYWETRDLEKLTKSINLFADLARPTAPTFRKLAEEIGFEVDAPVERSAKCLRVDVGGGASPPEGGAR